MTMRKRLLSLLLLISLALGLGVYSAAAAESDTLEDKTLYENDPLYIDLNLDTSTNSDDGNFAVMQDRAVILRADGTGMTMEMVESEDGTTYTLSNPTDEAREITAGTPVAFIKLNDPANMQTFFFLPQRVDAGTDRIVFYSDPENVEPEQLFKKIGINIKKDIPFNRNIDFSNPAKTIAVKGKVSGTLHIDIFYNLLKLETENYVEFDFEDISIEVDGNIQAEIPVLKIPIAGVPYVGLEIGIGVGVFVEGDTEIEFDMTGGRAGFKFSERLLPWPGKPSFENKSHQPETNVKEIIAEGDFELDITLGPSIDVIDLLGVGCDLAAGIEVTAELTGDEGGKGDSEGDGARPVDPSKWHICKELSCLKGEIDALAKVEAWAQIARSVYSISYELGRRELGEFHYSFTFNEFALAPCEHYVYLVDVKVVERSTMNPMKDVEIEYTPVPELADRKGEDYIKGKTDANGRIELYMPEGNVKITATSWQDDPLDPGGSKVHETVEYDVSPDGGKPRKVTIELRLYHIDYLIYFDENAFGAPVENMPSSFFIEQGHSGNLPNEVPRREGYTFMGWSTDKDGLAPIYLPGKEITPTGNTKLYAIWTMDPAIPKFCTIIYDANGGDLADNPQIYFKNQEGFPLINPTREDHIFIGWTGYNGNEPELQVTVQANSDEEFVNRVYIANWKHVTYNIIWRNWDSSWLDVTRDVEVNTDPDGLYDGPNPPTRASDEQFFYQFSHWRPDFTPVTTDAEYIAEYVSYDLLKLVSSPADQTLLAGAEAEFRVVVSGGEPPLSYQWYVIPASDAASNAEPIPGEESDILHVTASEQVNGNRYYCVVKDDVGQQVTSDPALLALSVPAPPATGDGFPLGPALTLLALSGAALALLARRGSRSSGKA